MAAEPVKARYSTLHNISMAVVVAGHDRAWRSLHFVNNPANAPTLSLNDPRFVLFFMLALALAYYVVLGISRTRNRAAAGRHRPRRHRAGLRPQPPLHLG